MSTRKAQKAEPIDVDEIDTMVFNFLPGIEDGETIASSTITCETHIGADADPEDVLVGAGTIDGNTVLQRIGGGIRGATYLLRCRAVLSSGRALVASALLPCVRL